MRVALSFAALSQDNAARRKPRAPWRPRPEGFWRAFEDRALYYDAFWAANGKDVLLIGPAPLSLAHGLETARYSAQPSGTALEARLFPSRSTMITRLADVPRGTSTVEVEAFGERFALEVQPNHAAALDNGRVLFTINKNNRLEWIADWARWHRVQHGTDTIILFDNGSTEYSLADIEAALARGGDFRAIVVISVPHKFGPIDRSVVMTRFYPRVLQISMTNLVLRRFAMSAQGIINCDIDELAWAGGQSLYDRASQSELGALRMRGRWIEAVRAPDAPVRHISFRQRLADVRHRLSPSKWVLDPRRDWVQSYDVQPYLHRIHGAPAIARRHDPEALFFHFKGINTNWKEDRTKVGSGLPARAVADETLDAAIACFEERGGE